MGFFSSKKKIYVSSVIYGMAGPEEDRPNYLQSLLTGHLFSKDKSKTIGQTLTDGYLTGPRQKLRNFYRWGQNHYGLIGMPNSSLAGSSAVDNEVLVNFIPHDSTKETVHIQQSDVEIGEIAYWGLRYVLENHSARAGEDYVTEYMGVNSAKVTFPNGDTYTFDPVGYDPTASYIAAQYMLSWNTDATPPEKVYGDNKVFIYRIGSGIPELDAMFVRQTSIGQYYPFIPIRIDNRFLSETYYPDSYRLAKKAYDKAFSSSYDELIEQLADNEQLHEIDYAYVAFGVPLNSKDMAAKKYLFRYFDKLRAEQITNYGDYNSWRNATNGYISQKDAWIAWMLSGMQGPEPYMGSSSSPPVNEVTIKATGSLPSNFDMVITWEEIRADVGSGLGRPGAKVGDVWWNIGNTDTYEYNVWNGTSGELDDIYNVDNVTITKQMTPNVWRRLTLIGMVHRNYIYQGNYVEIGMKEALQDPDESGFLVPLHDPTLREMSVVDATQLCMTTSNLVLNCYQIVKKKWYQRGIFKVLLVIAVVVITVVTGGVGAGSVGLLGTNLAVGIALGMAGMAAVIAGAVANALAAMIMLQLFNYAVTELFGAEIAMIINMIAMVYTMAVGGLANIGQSLSNAVTNLMQPQNLMMLTNSVGNVYANMINQDTQEIMQKSQEMIEEYTKQSREIAAKEREMFGGGTGFDPLALVGAPDYFNESSDSFLSRTLMTGTDIADLSNSLLSNFCDATLSTELS